MARLTPATRLRNGPGIDATRIDASAGPVEQNSERTVTISTRRDRVPTRAEGVDARGRPSDARSPSGKPRTCFGPDLGQEWLTTVRHDEPAPTSVYSALIRKKSEDPRPR